MEEPLDAHLTRFFGEDRSFGPEEEMEKIGTFLENRKSYIAQFLKDDFGLQGTLSTVQIETSDAAAGSVALNTITPTFDEAGKWQGDYFTDYPVSLTATAGEGYRFTGWEVESAQGHESIEEASTKLTIPEGGLTVRAVFEKESD